MHRFFVSLSIACCATFAAPVFADNSPEHSHEQMLAIAELPAAAEDHGNVATSLQWEEHFREKLQLTPEQTPAWEAFAEKMRPAKKEDTPRITKEDRQKMTVPQRMEFVADNLQKAAMLAKERAQAMQTFYAVLTPEQQKTMNEHFTMMTRPTRPYLHHKKAAGTAQPAQVAAPTMENPPASATQSGQ